MREAARLIGWQRLGRERLWLAALGLGSLAAGALFYVACRDTPPLLFAWGARGKHACGALLPWMLASLPSGLHALGFTLLLVAAGRPHLGRAVASAFLWVGLSATWEAACHPAFPWEATLLSAAAVASFAPDAEVSCSADAGDVLAAAIGAGLAVALVFALTGSSARRPRQSY